MALGDIITHGGLPYINVTPVMTGNTTPSPYVVSSSSVYSTSYPAWKAFNNSIALESDGWLSSSSASTGWIQIDIGKSILVNCYSLVKTNVGNANVLPKDFTLQGSNDGITFIDLHTANNQTNWTNEEVRFYNFNNINKYRYYRLNIKANNGHAYTGVGELNFYATYSKVLILKNNQYFSVLKNFYDTDLQQYAPLETTDFNNAFDMSDLLKEMTIGGEIEDGFHTMILNNATSIIIQMFNYIENIMFVY